jgi:hypothetical protein
MEDAIAVALEAGSIGVGRFLSGSVTGADSLRGVGGQRDGVGLFPEFASSNLG